MYAVINATYAVAKRKPNFFRLSFGNRMSCVNNCEDLLYIYFLYDYWPSGNPNLLHHRSTEGYCENIPQAAVRGELWVGPCRCYAVANALTGWNLVSRIMIEEVARAQSWNMTLETVL